MTPSRLVLSLALGGVLAFGCGSGSSSSSGNLSDPTPQGSATGGGTGTGGGTLTGTSSGTETGSTGGTTTGTTGTSTGSGSAATGAWLTTSGNRILLPDGSRWHGRGANLPDFRGCGSSLSGPPNLNELERRVDTLVDDWHANVIRLDLESDSSTAGGKAPNVLGDAQYLAAVEEVVRYIEAKNVYVILSLWIDPTFDANGWPTAATADEWKLLATQFAHDDRVLFGLVNEPKNNADGSLDAQVWAAMNSTVQAIRDAEAAAGGGSHLVAVQGTGSWGRRASYYVQHPITAGGGKNVAYEIHIYNPQTEFDALLAPASTLPMIIGEFGPSTDATAPMTVADAQALMARATTLELPHLAWAFHMRCAPNLIQDLSNGGDGTGMSLVPTDWGNALREHLAQPW